MDTKQKVGDSIIIIFLWINKLKHRKLSNSPKVAQLIRGRAGIQTSNRVAAELMLLNYTALLKAIFKPSLIKHAAWILPRVSHACGRKNFLPC